MSFIYQLYYFLGFTPWDRGLGEVPQELRDLIEGPVALPKGRAIDLGCGFGRFSIYLAQQGFSVTGIDAVERALALARKRAIERNLDVRFIHGDVTRLENSEIGGPFDFFIDAGCFHSMTDEERQRYGESILPFSKPGTVFLMFAFKPGKRILGPRGAALADVERCFGAHWDIQSVEPDSHKRRIALGSVLEGVWYRMQRRAS